MSKFDDDCNAATEEFNKKALDDLVGLAQEETKRLNELSKRSKVKIVARSTE